MERREVLGLLGAGTLGLLATEGKAAAAAADDAMTYHSQLPEMQRHCLDACTACAAVCNESAHHCLAELAHGAEHHDHHALAHGLAMDCAAMCGMSAALIARSSPLMGAQCGACAEACSACAKACENDMSGAAIMKECARICRACEKSCREMAHHGHAVR